MVVNVGPNAIRILREIGVFDEVLTSSGEACLDRKSFLFRSGLGEHEVIYDVSPSISGTLKSFLSEVSQDPVEPEDEVRSIHRFRTSAGRLSLSDCGNL